MGLISRVSSRTYRVVHKKFFKKKNQYFHKNNDQSHLSFSVINVLFSHTVNIILKNNGVNKKTTTFIRILIYIKSSSIIYQKKNNFEKKITQNKKKNDYSY